MFSNGDGQPHTERPKVFGVGMPRTGTTSLTEALTILGYNAMHNPVEVLSFDNNDVAMVPERAAKYDALTDIPVTRFYKDLDAAFPGSKFILTERDAESWYKSMQKLREPHVLSVLFPKVRKLFYKTFDTYSFDDKEQLCAKFEEHNKDVREYFASRPGDLLILDMRQENPWKDLCAFLEVQEPQGIPFPWTNSSTSVSVVNMVRDFLRV